MDRMLNDTSTKRATSSSGPRGFFGDLRRAAEDAISHGREHIYEVKYQLRLSFIVIVVIPTVLAMTYYLLIAAPRYVATAQFAVWTSSPPRADPLTMLVQLPNSTSSLEDQHIVEDYINSRSMLESIEQQFDLDRIYGTGGDLFAEMGSGLTVERRVEYWKKHVDVTIDSNSGITTLEVDAFRPQDALTMARAVLARAQTMVQNLSDEGDADAVRQSKRQFDATGKLLSDVRAHITQFRRQNHMVDATHTGELTLQMVGGLEASLAETQSQIQQLRTYLKPDDPRISVLQARANSLRQQIDLQKTGLAETAAPFVANGSSSPDVLPASVLAQSEVLETELDVALKGYMVAAAAYYQAQGNLLEHRRFLEVFVKPALPEDADKPERFRMIATVFLTSLIVWCLVITIGGAVRDHAGV